MNFKTKNVECICNQILRSNILLQHIKDAQRRKFIRPLQNLHFLYFELYRYINPPAIIGYQRTETMQFVTKLLRK